MSVKVKIKLTDSDAKKFLKDAAPADDSKVRKFVHASVTNDKKIRTRE